MSLEKMFLHEKTVEILVKILEAEENGEEPYPLGISKEIGSPYSYISKVLSEFEANALIESEFKGRIRVVRFTEDGRKIAELLRQLRNELRKDFVSRKKLFTLKSVIDEVNGVEGDEKLRKLIPVKLELEKIASETEDEDIIREVTSLIKRVEELMG